MYENMAENNKFFLKFPLFSAENRAGKFKKKNANFPLVRAAI